MAAEAAVKTARINIERQGILFEKGLSAAIPLISAGFCSKEMKASYQELLERRWERLQETNARD
jgi:hypothetical protein